MNEDAWKICEYILCGCYAVVEKRFNNDIRMRENMWNKIVDDKTLINLLEEMEFFHDVCLTELRYISGAYVDEDLALYPINDKRRVNVFIQRQEEERNTIELEFSGIEYLKLFPYDEKYTCEIFGITLILENGKIFWCDCDGISKDEFPDYKGISICASELKWRWVENG